MTDDELFKLLVYFVKSIVYQSKDPINFLYRAEELIEELTEDVSWIEEK